MAFKFVVFCSLLAFVNAGVIAPATYTLATPVIHHQVNPSVDAVASTQQNVVRSFDGTLSSYSKAIDTPYSSVRKQDTRISNNVYTPAVAKTVSYAAPALTYAAPAKTVTYAAPAVVKTVSYAAPVTKTISYAAPAATKTAYAQAPVPTTAVYTHSAPVHYSQPAQTVYTHAAPVPTATVFTHAAPAIAKTVTTYAAPTATTSLSHGPVATTYSHNAPGVSSYGTTQTVHYSPAEMVSHMSFDGFGTHWGF